MFVILVQCSSLQALLCIQQQDPELKINVTIQSFSNRNRKLIIQGCNARKFFVTGKEVPFAYIK